MQVIVPSDNLTAQDLQDLTERRRHCYKNIPVAQNLPEGDILIKVVPVHLRPKASTLMGRFRRVVQYLVSIILVNQFVESGSRAS